jgi:hypothetical protein
MNYATLVEMKRYLGTDETTDDALLTKLLAWSSRFIDIWKGRRFDVRFETRYFDRPSGNRSAFGVFDSSLLTGSAGSALRLDNDLLEISSLINGDGDEILSSAFTLEPANMYPKRRIRLKSAADYWSGDSYGDYEQVISVSGWWGYHDDYPNCFVDSLDVVTTTPLDDSGISLIVADADGTAGDLLSPRFQAGQMIQIGTELMLVISVNTTSNSLVVLRGYNGSTAAAHLVGVKIAVFRVMGTIETACIRLVKWRYTQKDTDNFDKTYILGVGQVNVPTAIPSDVLMVLGPRKAGL